MKTVITYGTFDMFHIGHLKLLERAKELGDRLIVAVSSDELNKVKGKKVIIPYDQRAKIVESIKFVDMVIPEDNWEQKIKDVKDNNVDIFVMGDDWEGKFDFLKEHCEVVYLSRTKNVSTTQFKNSAESIIKLLEQMVKELE
ncbi:glycerol-3-phosphate cytidylyltransferase [Candidatus Woesearchaeota archaeon]|nr:MAG: glycerol-3-phosphate cytidylyltransferase [Candidatus Woesearchaeota archaeon]